MADLKKQIETVSSNVTELSARISSAAEQLDISIGQLARLEAEMDARLSIDRLYAEFCRCCDLADGRAKAILCRVLSEDVGSSQKIEDRNIFGNGDAPVPGTHGRIAYVRNKRNDQVYLEFSERMVSARAHYGNSFAETCEAVFNNECEFCILPIENNTEGKLYSFYAMIDRYELRICDVIHITDADGQKTAFALVGRSVSVPKGKGITQRFEFSVVCRDMIFPHDIASAALALGGRILSVGTQPVQYDDTENKYYFTVDFEGVGAVAMALYMSLEYPRYTPLGVYAAKK